MTLLSSAIRRQVLSLANSTICSRRFVKPLIRRPIETLSKTESEEFHKKKPNFITCTIQNQKIFSLKNYEHLGFTCLRYGDERFGLYLSKAKESQNASVKNPKIILEGTRLIADAINAEADIKCLYFTNQDILNMLPLQKLTSSTSLYQVRQVEMKTLSETTDSSGLLAVACKPKFTNNYSPLLPLTMVLDGIEDEGHLGTLIRSAAAAGIERVFVTSNTVDPWSPKAIRSAMGGHFFVPVITIDQQNLEGQICNAKSVYIVDLEPRWNNSMNLQDSQEKPKILKDFHRINYDEIVFKKNSILMIGIKESRKIFQKNSSNASFITSPHNFDHFNPAINGSVILYEMKRQFDNNKS